MKASFFFSLFRSLSQLLKILFLLLFISNQVFSQINMEKGYKNGFYLLNKKDLSEEKHHTRHAEIFGKYVEGINYKVLQAIDVVQATAPDGGGYFANIKADPPESPIGYELKLFGRSLLNPPRTTSYCSGASYAAFIETINLHFIDVNPELSYERYEALRMQEEDGGRREDRIKYWGKWNDDGYGCNYALVQYSEMGIDIKPEDALPGDFVNIIWKSGGGHSVVFLGWYKDEDSALNLVYWSSQKSTNGLGDVVVPIEKIKNVKFVRVTKPDKIFTFNPLTEIDRKISADVINPAK